MMSAAGLAAGVEVGVGGRVGFSRASSKPRRDIFLYQVFPKLAAGSRPPPRRSAERDEKFAAVWAISPFM